MKSLAFIAIALWVQALAAWLTHVIWAIKTLMGAAASTGQIVLSIGGTVVPPIGVIHGWILWFS